MYSVANHPLSQMRWLPDIDFLRPGLLFTHPLVPFHTHPAMSSMLGVRSMWRRKMQEYLLSDVRSRGRWSAVTLGERGCRWQEVWGGLRSTLGDWQRERTEKICSRCGRSGDVGLAADREVDLQSL